MTLVEMKQVYIGISLPIDDFIAADKIVRDKHGQGKTIYFMFDTYNAWYHINAHWIIDSLGADGAVDDRFCDGIEDSLDYFEFQKVLQRINSPSGWYFMNEWSTPPFYPKSGKSEEEMI